MAFLLRFGNVDTGSVARRESSGGFNNDQGASHLANPFQLTQGSRSSGQVARLTDGRGGSFATVTPVIRASVGVASTGVGAAKAGVGHAPPSWKLWSRCLPRGVPHQQPRFPQFHPPARDQSPNPSNYIGSTDTPYCYHSFGWSLGSFLPAGSQHNPLGIPRLLHG